MRFWDTSALTPLLVREANSGLRESQLRTDGQILVWYGTAVEIESALCRRKRDGSLAADAEALARRRLMDLVAGWAEVEPLRSVRDRACRLLRVHTFRSADAMQLAAALVATGERPQGFAFLTGDVRLRSAAEAEGFTVG